MRTVLFVCSGNTCRSPLAEAIARHWLDTLPESDREDVFVASAGLFASDGMPPTPETIEALRNHGIDFDGRSTALNAEMIRKADVVLAMTSAHIEAIREMVAEGDVDTVIEQLDPEDSVPDPIGQGQSAYDALVERFQKLIPKRLKETLFHEDRAGVRSSR